MDEEQDEHTPDNPYCGRWGCWCHSNVSYHEIVTHPEPTETELETAYNFFELQQVAA